MKKGGKMGKGGYGKGSTKGGSNLSLPAASKGGRGLSSHMAKSPKGKSGMKGC